jgi:chitinase
MFFSRYLCGSALALCALPLFAAQVDFGYGVFNLTFEQQQAIHSISFDYGNPNFTLDSISWLNPAVKKQLLANGLTHYTVTAPSSKGFAANLRIGQIPLLPASVPQKNMPFNQYYGLWQNVKVNGQSASLHMAQPADQAQDPAPGQLLGAYYADWTVYAGHGHYRPQQIPFKHINTLFYAFGSLDPVTGDAELFDPYADAQMSGNNALPYLRLQKNRYPYLNLIYSFGGWGSIANDNYQSGDMSVLFTYYPEKIQHFADTLTQAMLRTGFNGIDIDYEWAGPFESVATRLGGHAPLCTMQQGICRTTKLTQAEADGYAELLYDLRQNLKQLKSPEKYLLTSAFFSGPDKIQAMAHFHYKGKIEALQGQSDLQIAVDNLSYLDLMTYDMHGNFDAGQTAPNNVADLQSRLYQNPHAPQSKGLAQYSVNNAVQALEQAVAIAPEKIVIGIPLYARIVRLAKQSDQHLQGIYAPLASSEQQAILGSDVAGEFDGDFAIQNLTGGGRQAIGSAMVDYKCLIHLPSDANNPSCYYGYNHGSHPLAQDMQLFGIDQLPRTAEPGYFAAAAWGYGAQSRTFMSFDSPASAKNKAQFIRQHHLGGVMLWEIDGDVSTSAPDFKEHSITYALAQSLKQ